MRYLWCVILLVSAMVAKGQIFPISYGELQNNLSANSYGIDLVGGLQFEETSRTVSSGGVLAMPTRSRFFVTGTNTISSVTNGVPGKVYILQAKTSFTLSSNATIRVYGGTFDMVSNDVAIIFATGPQNVTVIR